MIEMRNFKVRVPGERDALVGYEGENEARQIVIHVDEIDGWQYKLDLERVNTQEKFTFDMLADGNDIIATLDRAHVAVPGTLDAQVRALNGEVEKKSNIFHLRVGDSVNATGELLPLPPNEFEQMEQNLTAIKQQAVQAAGRAEDAADEAETFSKNAPKIVDGTWWTYDPDDMEYKDTGVEAQGEQGIQGPQGIRGAPGPKGNTGPVGPQGEPGKVGPQGPQGIQGVPGPKGEQGPQGEKGETGDTGPQGDPGQTGPQGQKGDKGDRGDRGAPGPQGEKGEQGRGFVVMGYYDSLETLQGMHPTAQAGDAYGIGVAQPYEIYVWDGISGVWVNNGPIQGAQGQKGDPGEPGQQGPKGDPGEKGEKGDPGAPGERGEQGPRGAPGEKGADGTIYTPAVSLDGTLSWTNDGGLPNPDAINIRGQKGDPGQDGEQGPAGASATINGVNALMLHAVGGLTGTQSGDTYTIDGAGLVPGTRKVNGKPLSADVSLTADDVGARANNWIPTAPETGAIPASEKGAAFGVATLDETGKVPTGQLPPMAYDPAGSAAGALSDAKKYADGLTATDVGAIPTVNGSAGQFLGFTFANVVGAVDAPSGGAGKRVCRFVVGTSVSGWTEDDCDYLCDGTDDQVEINAAIQALPSGGGEIVILDGTYNITATIAMNKDNVKLSGNGNATVLKRMWSSSVEEGIITITAINGGCCVKNFYIDGNKKNSNNYYDNGICVSSSNHNILTENICNNNDNGVMLYDNSFYNMVIGNSFNENNSYGILLYTSCNFNHLVANFLRKNNSGSIGLENSSANTITGNTCIDNNNFNISLINAQSNAITGNTCSKCYNGVYLVDSIKNTIAGNLITNSNTGIFLSSCDTNNITGNTIIRNYGSSSDYTSTQYTIRLNGNDNNNNLISSNNIMGKNYVSGGGTGNIFVNNKYN